MSQFKPNTLTATVDVEFATGTKAKTLTFVGNGGNIPDGIGSFQDDIIIEDNFRITNLSVTLKDLAHTWVGDLVVRLRHLETDTVVELFRRPGQPHFSSSGYSSDVRGDYRFSDSHTCNFDATAATNTVIPSGNYTSLQPLSMFNGLSSTGTWRLIINDCSAGDSGSLSAWSLNLSWG